VPGVPSRFKSAINASARTKKRTNPKGIVMVLPRCPEVKSEVSKVESEVLRAKSKLKLESEVMTYEGEVIASETEIYFVRGGPLYER
jgi:hypothetical protein